MYPFILVVHAEALHELGEPKALADTYTHACTHIHTQTRQAHGHTMSCGSPRLSKAGRLAAISYSTHPKLHTSEA